MSASEVGSGVPVQPPLLVTLGDNCPTCGERLIGDGCTVVRHCPNAGDDRYWHSEPDAAPVFCTLLDHE